MDALFENPLRIALYGAAIEVVLLIILFITRRGVLLWGVGGVLVVFGAWIGVERLVVTERERVVMALDDGIEALLTNDKKIVESRCLSPSAKETRQLLAMGYGMVHMTYAEYAGLEVELDRDAKPPKAVTHFLAKLFFRGKTPDIAFDRYFCNMTVRFQKENGRWLVVDPVEGTPLKP